MATDLARDLFLFDLESKQRFWKRFIPIFFDLCFGLHGGRDLLYVQ